MTFLERVKLSLMGVSSNKFRSFLTLLGIIIGVGAVILMVSLGSGTQKVISGQFQSIITRQIYLSPNYNLSYNHRGKLTLEDEVYLEETIMGVKDVVPFYRGYFTVKYGGKEGQYNAAGVQEGALEVTNLTLKYGRFINEEDVKNREKVAVVGENIIGKLTDKDPHTMLGEEISVDNNKILVVGILGLSNSTVALPNDVVIIPLTAYEDLWRTQAREFNNFLVTYDDDTTEKDIIAQIKYLLDNKYGTTRGESKFYVEGLQGQVEIMNRVIQVFTYVLGGIAAISLFVGGIGVMNIMLVTVKERTREIGIRMAIGANRKDIQSQFLLEAILLTAGGGLLGIIIGSGFSSLLNFFLGRLHKWWQGTVPLWIVLLSFGVTATIGIVFGFYPAYKASKLDPIEALRYE